jgi:hypothetical protein
MDPAFDEERVGDYPSFELSEHISSSSPLSPSCRRLRLISPHLVSKFISTREAPDELAGHRLAQYLGIRVPDIKREVRVDRGVWAVMSRISGTPLDEAWSRLGWLVTIRLAFQLRRFILAMRTLKSSTAGALVSGKCNSIWLDDYYGLPPRATPEAIISFFRFWLRYSLMRPPQQSAHEALVPPISAFVFTHQDLAPRNMLVDEHEQLWLLDWQMSGWYPVYFEDVSMQNFQAPQWSWSAWLRWRIFVWISVGVYTRERRALNIVRYKFQRSPLGRKTVVEGDDAL